ncbi:MAG: hypothetical protein AMJ53_10555 [Gammaproteobacteria bacterium SG8_11]|jgi:hypothetical protein|nr:MAG: hypothetical protein AMJ53_10555 [Gammaproteobacteria bacterium SG8_11]
MKIHAGFVSLISTVFLGSILFSTATLARSTPVTVVNTDTEPVPTKEAVPREPWQKAVIVTGSYSQDPPYHFEAAGTQSVPVPPDKRLVIETITMSTSTDAAYLVDLLEYFPFTIPELTITTTVAGETVTYDFPVPELFTGYTCNEEDCWEEVFFKAHVNTRIYADPNTNVDATVTLRNRPFAGKVAAKKKAVNATIDFTVNLSGYLIPADSASLSP